MKSSAGEHYIALDHIRALAAFLVFAWHFTHGFNGSPISFAYAPSLFLLAPLDEGHTGVALFMTLSGYLFAKLLDGRKILFRAFYWNRFVRLVPLLTVVLIIAGVGTLYAGVTLREYLTAVGWGIFLPTLPNGAWSITVELHFYLLLPSLLWLSRRSVTPLLGIVIGAVILRLLIYTFHGQVNWLAYWTLIGRIDQFVFGIVAYRLRHIMRSRSEAAAAIVVLFCLVYWIFDLNGGIKVSPSLRSESPLWIVFPAIEGACFSWLIAYYDTTYSPPARGISWAMGRIGAYSYSIYLFHFFVVFKAAELVDRHVIPLSNFYVANLAAFCCFLLMVPVGFCSFRLIEEPFLRLRIKYVLPADKPRDSRSLFGPRSVEAGAREKLL